MTVSKPDLANNTQATALSHIMCHMMWLQVNQAPVGLLSTLWLLDLQQA